MRIVNRCLWLLPVIWATGCTSSTPDVKEPTMSKAEVRTKLEKVLWLGGPTSPTLAALYPNYDITSILLEIARDPNLDWYTRPANRKIEDEDDAIRLRGNIWFNIFRIFDHFQDERGYLFQIEAYNDRSIPGLTRRPAIQCLYNANNAHVRDFFISILEDHARQRLYSADGLLVLRYIRNSVKFHPNHLWTPRTKKAYIDYLDMLEQYAKDHQGQDDIPSSETFEESRRAIAVLDGNR